MSDAGRSQTRWSRFIDSPWSEFLPVVIFGVGIVAILVVLT